MLHDYSLDPLAHLGAELLAKYYAQYGSRLAQIKSLSEQASALDRQLQGALLLPPGHPGRETIPGITAQRDALLASATAQRASLDSDLATAAAPYIAIQAERAALGAEIAGIEKSLATISLLPPAHPAQQQVPTLEAERIVLREQLAALT